MSAHGARQQRKLAKKKAEREQKRRLLAIRQSPGLPELAAMCRRGVILKTAVSQETFDGGPGYAWISRKLPDGRVTFASFMLDVWCLGVMDVTFVVGTASDVDAASSMSRKCSRLKATASVAWRTLRTTGAITIFTIRWKGIGWSGSPHIRGTAPFHWPRAVESVSAMSSCETKHYPEP